MQIVAAVLYVVEVDNYRMALSKAHTSAFSAKRWHIGPYVTYHQKSKIFENQLSGFFANATDKQTKTMWQFGTSVFNEVVRWRRLGEAEYVYVA